MASLKWYEAALKAINVSNSTRGAIFDPEVRRDQEREMKNRDLLATYENVVAATEDRKFRVLTDPKTQLNPRAQDCVDECQRVNDVDPAKLEELLDPKKGAEWGVYVFGTLNDFLVNTRNEPPLTQQEIRELSSFVESRGIYPEPISLEACWQALHLEGCVRALPTPKPILSEAPVDDLDSYRQPNPYSPNSIEFQRFHERDGMLARQQRDAKQALDGARAERMTMLEKSPVWQEAMVSLYKSAGRDEIVSDDAQLGLWRFYERNAMKFGEPTVRSIRAAAISYWGSDTVKLLPSELGEREFAAVSPEDMKKYMAAQSSALTPGIMGNLHPVQYGG